MAKKDAKTTDKTRNSADSSKKYYAGSMKAVGRGQSAAAYNKNYGSVKNLYSSGANNKSENNKKNEKETPNSPAFTAPAVIPALNAAAGNRDRAAKRAGGTPYSKAMYNDAWAERPKVAVNYGIDTSGSKKDTEDKVDVGQLVWGIGDQAATEFVGNIVGTADMLIGTPYQKYLDYREEKYGLADRGENAITAYNKKFQEKARAEAEYYARNASKNELASLLNEYGPDVLALLPDIALAYFSGGLSAAAKGTLAAGKAASFAGKAAKMDDILDAAKTAGKFVGKNPAVLSGAVQSTGYSYNQALAEGADFNEARNYALLNGMLDLGFNSVGLAHGQAGMETLPEILRTTNKPAQWALSYGKAVLHDGLEGVAQGTAQRASRGIYDKDVELFSTDNPNAVFNPNAAAMDFALGGAGAAVVGGMHAGTKALDAPAEAAASRLEKAYFRHHIMEGDPKLNKESAIEQANLLSKLTHGQLLNSKEIAQLDMSNKEIQNLFTRETGVPLSVSNLGASNQAVLRQKLNFAATKVKNGDAVGDANKYPLAKLSDQIYNNIAQNPKSHIYKHGDWAGKTIKTENEVFNGKPLKAYTSYVCGDNNYIYQTDGAGRIQNATGVLLLKNKEKNKKREHMPSRQTPGKLKGDDAGHIFADMFGGSPKLLNLVSENAHVNRSEHKKVENLLKKALENGENVYVDYDLHYSADSVRPDKFTITYYHGNDYGKMETFTETIFNPEPAPKKAKK